MLCLKMFIRMCVCVFTHVCGHICRCHFLGPDYLDLNTDFSFSNSIMLGNFRYFSAPQFPHLYDRDNDYSQLIRLLSRVSELIHWKHSFNRFTQWLCAIYWLPLGLKYIYLLIAFQVFILRLSVQQCERHTFQNCHVLPFKYLFFSIVYNAWSPNVFRC